MYHEAYFDFAQYALFLLAEWSDALREAEVSKSAEIVYLIVNCSNEIGGLCFKMIPECAIYC